MPFGTSQYTLTGRQGEVYVDSVRVRRITSWSVNPTLATSTEWGDSDVNGFTARAAGRWDCTFTTEGKYDTRANTVFEQFQPGLSGNPNISTTEPSSYNYATVYLWIEAEPTSTPPGVVDDNFWYFPRALCTDFSMTVDVDTEEVIGWTASWGADGRFFFPNQTGAEGVSAPAFG